MKIKESFKVLEKPDNLEQEALQDYLKNLYGDDDYEAKDAAYVDDSEPQLVVGYKQRTNILLDKLILISDNPKFEQLRPALTDDVLPGKMRDITDELKKTAEIICYRAENHLIDSPKKFEAEIRSATIDACAPGALTNMQIIASSMDDSFYNSKYEYIKNLATEYVREHKLSDRYGNEVHRANELIHEVSQEYHVYPPKDVHAKYRDLSLPPNDNFKVNANFKNYLNDIVNTRKGIHSLVEVVSNNYLNRLPHSPEIGMLPAKEGGNNSAAFEQVLSIASSVGVTLDDIIEYNNDYTEFKYSDNYQDVIQAATMHRLSQEGLIDQQALEYTEVNIMAAHTKFVRNAANELVREDIPERRIERKITVIESPNAWYTTSQQNGCLTIEEQLFNSMKLKNLTIDGQSFEDYLHNKLADKMELELENALRIIIEANEDRIALEQPDLIKELILLSDQVKDLEKYLTKEELSSLSNDDLNKWIDFNKSPDKLKFIAKFGTGLMLEKHLEGENTTVQEFMESRDSYHFCFNAVVDNLNIELISFIKSFIKKQEVKLIPIESYLSHAFINASKNKKYETITKLIELGADINGQKHDGMNALHHAAKNGQVETITKLIELGADIGNKSETGIDRSMNGMTALHYAIKNNKINAIEKLVELGADIKVADIKGRTALIYAVGYGEYGAAKTLIKLGADVADLNAKNNLGEIFLHFAAGWGNYHAVKELLELGADIHIKDDQGKTALHRAAETKRLEILEHLVRFGANINAKDTNGLTPLHHAAKNEQIESIEKLLELGADINIKNNKGKTVLEVLNPDIQNKLATHLAKASKDKLPKIINNLAQQSKDNPKAWDLIDETMAKVNPKDRPIIIIRTLKQINNDSYKEILLKHLPKNEETLRLPKVEPTLWQSIVRNAELIYGNSSIDPPERKAKFHKRINQANNNPNRIR